MLRNLLIFACIAFFAVGISPSKADVVTIKLSGYDIKYHPINPTWVNVEASGNSTYINSLGSVTGHAFTSRIDATENATIQNNEKNKIENIYISNTAKFHNSGDVNQRLTIYDDAKAYNHGTIGTVELQGGVFHNFNHASSSVSRVDNYGGSIYNNGYLTHVNLYGQDAVLTQTYSTGYVWNLRVYDGASLDTSLNSGTFRSISINDGSGLDFFVYSPDDYTKLYFEDSGSLSTLYMNKGSSINVDFTEFFLSDPLATSFNLADLFSVRLSNGRYSQYNYSTFFSRNGNGYYNFIGLDGRTFTIDEMDRSTIYFSEKPSSATPEPGSIVIFSLMGVAGAGLCRYRRKKSC